MIARSHEEFVIEHYNKYDSPDCPPSWKTMEVASFGTLSKLFSNLANTDIKKVISRSFQLPSYVFLENWMKCAAVLRNCCAHHARLWNRRFSVIPKYPANLQGEWIVTPLRRPEKLYGQLCYLAYMEQSIHPNSQLKRSLINIMSKHPEISLNAMGFQLDWQEQPLWNISKWSFRNKIIPKASMYRLYRFVSVYQYRYKWNKWNKRNKQDPTAGNGYSQFQNNISIRFPGFNFAASNSALRFAQCNNALCARLQVIGDRKHVTGRKSSFP